MRFLSKLFSSFLPSSSFPPYAGGWGAGGWGGEWVDDAQAQWLQEAKIRLQRYEGIYPRSLSLTSDGVDDNVTINYARTIVDKSVSFLFSSHPNWGLEEREALLVDEVWRRSGGDTLLDKIATNGAIFGTAYVLISLSPTLSPTPSSTPPIRLINLNPLLVRAKTLPNDVDTIQEWTITWEEMIEDKPKLHRQRIFSLLPSENAWKIVDEIGDGLAPSSWTTIGEEIWPYPFCPLLHTQNLPSPNTFHGRPDFDEDLLKVNEAINYTLSNIRRILRFHAHPRTWGKGFSAKDIDFSPNKILILPNPSAELSNLEMQSDLQAAIEYYRRLSELLHMMARTPEISTGRTETLGNLSGSAIKIMYGPLIEKTKTKRRLYGSFLNEINRRILYIRGIVDAKPHLVWPDIISLDDKEEAQTALLLKSLGVSTHTLLLRLGYDPIKEASLSSEEELLRGGGGGEERGEMGDGGGGM